MFIQKLINDGFKAIIVECGHGALISNEFLSTKSASKLVIKCVQPYDKEVQQIEYPNTFGLRSVSKEFVRNVLKTELDNYKYLYPDNPLMCIATSFQLGDDKSGTICHGYLGIGNVMSSGNRYHIYHVTFYQGGLSKKSWISHIRSELMNIMSKVCGMNGNHDVRHLDGVWEASDNEPLVANIERTLALNNNFVDYNYPHDENFICVTPNNELIRFEDLVRRNLGEKRGIIMQKGSFNPFHRMHNNIAQDAINAYPDYPHVLVLSNNTCDKGVNDEKVLTSRIEKLTALGYYVMVTKSGQFLHNVNKIRSFYEDLEIIFPVGEDTIERFFRDWEAFFNAEVNHVSMRYTQYMYAFKDVEWYITGRNSETKHFGELLPKYKEYLNNFKYSTLDMDDISSSSIRAGKHENKL